jgi:ATP-binding cassette subfamily F protein uup
MSIEEAVLRDIPPEQREEAEVLARTYLSKAHFEDFSIDSSTLSGGWKKRLDLVKAMVEQPELLLLDEPTNHLDLEGILWLEKFLLRERVPFLVVSHDRYFLRNICQKFIEINRCFPDGIFESTGSLDQFLSAKSYFCKGS